MHLLVSNDELASTVNAKTGTKTAAEAETYAASPVLWWDTSGFRRQEILEVLQLQIVDKVDVPMIIQRHVPTVQVVQQMVEVPLVEYAERVVDTAQRVHETAENQQLQFLKHGVGYAHGGATSSADGC